MSEPRTDLTITNPEPATQNQQPRTVISTEAAHSLIVRSAVEKSASLPRPSPSRAALGWQSPSKSKHVVILSDEVK
jgi:hypothetical protein